MAPAAGLSPPLAALALVPGLEAGGAPKFLERLCGGQVNETWRVDTSQGRFTLRIDGPAAMRPGVDRQLERLLHGAAAAAGFAPRIVSAAPGLQVLVCEFLAGRTWSMGDFHDSASLARLGERLAALHDIPSPAQPSRRFDPCALAGRYLEQARSAGATLAGAQAVVLQLQRSWAAIEATAAPPCIVHGDLPNGNVLENSQLWLLDWEYAQLADPICDIACIVAQVPLAPRLQQLLLSSSGLESRKDAQRLADAVYIYRGLTWAWHLARAEPSTPPSFG
jgi:aminoglycoside phosphotransferase (APT) family kinase protein